MKLQQLKIIDVMFLLAILLGISVRFLRIGVAPLSDFEAERALQALAISKGEEVAIGSQPGYVLLTGLFFFIFGNANAIARLLPAIAGSLLVALPYFFRNQLGTKAALIMAFGLALDPGLVALSRLAGGPMIAAGFGAAAFAFWFAGIPAIAGVLGGLALLGGPAMFHGALGAVLALGLGWMLINFNSLEGFELKNHSARSKNEWRQPVIAGIIAVFLLGTLFFVYPSGLAALVGSLPLYLNGWLTGSGVPASRLAAALVVYQPVALIFGLAAMVRGWVKKSKLLRWLSIWVLSSFALVLIYPNREVGDLVWVLLPLWSLASLEIARQLQSQEVERLPALGQATLVVVLIVLAWINLAGLNLSGVDEQVYRLRWAVIGGVLALIAITTGLVALGWSATIAQRGLAWGLGLSLSIYLAATLWSVSQLRGNGEQELFSPPPATQQTELLMDTLGDLAEFRTGLRDTLDMVVTVQNPSVRWVLRNWNELYFADTVAVGELPSAVLSSGDDPSPRFSVSYRGQDFAWSVHPAWDGALPPNWPNWLTFRGAPQRTEPIILWVRGDIFPGGTLATVEEDQK
ncbi:MAG TPA: hypothetical protein VIK64_01505 [Anaerolineales bacterium]